MKYLDKTFSTPSNSKKYRDNFDAVFGKKKTGRVTFKGTYPPGSSEARAGGCSCPVLDNMDAGGARYYVNAGCTMHGVSDGER